MKHAAAARKEVGLRSIFNMLGPLTNPAGADAQLLGVFAPQLTEMFAEALRLLGSETCLGRARPRRPGRDFGLCADARDRASDGLIRTYDIDPRAASRPSRGPGRGGRRRPAAQRRDHAAHPGGRAGGLPRRGPAERGRRPGGSRQGRHLEHGLRLAAGSIDSGAARQKLDDWSTSPAGG